MNRKTSQHNFGIAACAILIMPIGEVQLFPTGYFRVRNRCQVFDLLQDVSDEYWQNLPEIL